MLALGAGSTVACARHSCRTSIMLCSSRRPLRAGRHWGAALCNVILHICHRVMSTQQDLHWPCISDRPHAGITTYQLPAACSCTPAPCRMLSDTST